MSDEQAVIKTDAEVEPSVEDNDAQDLDALLREYDEGTQEPKQAPSEEKELLEYLKQQRDADLVKQTQEDLNNAVTLVQEGLSDLPVKVSNRVVKGLLNEIAYEDQRLKTAFENRHKNPQAWNRIVKQVRKTVREDFSVDKTLTDDRDAVASAVKSASTTKEADETPNIGRMSDSEFLAYKSSLMRR